MSDIILSLQPTAPCILAEVDGVLRVSYPGFAQVQISVAHKRWYLKLRMSQWLSTSSLCV